MSALILIFACLILLAGVMLLANPEIIFGYLKDNIENSAIHVIAVLSRLIIGAMLIAQSSLSRFPMGIEILGWVFVVAGLALALIGKNKFRQIITWVLIKFQPFGRLAGILAIAFGGFLVFAFL